MYVIEALAREGARIRAFDRAAPVGVVDHLATVEHVADPYEAITDAGVVALLTEWDELRALDFRRVHDAMRSPHAVVDARNLLDPPLLRILGFTYQGIGR